MMPLEMAQKELNRRMDDLVRNPYLKGRPSSGPVDSLDQTFCWRGGRRNPHYIA